MWRVLILLSCTVGLVACSAEGESEEEGPRPEPRVAEVDLEIGVEEGEPPYMFGRISGVTVDEQGHVYVADRQAHEVRAFARDGTFQFAIGGPGEGPGELDQPCCPAIGPRDHLWVRDDQNRRYNRYRLEADGAVPAGQISMEHSTFGLMTATTFDEEDRLVDVGSKRGDEIGDSRTVRIHRTLDDETVHEQLIPEAPDGRIPVYEAKIEGGIAFYSQPGGPRAQNAHGPDGDWAFAITDRYEVVRFDADGDTLHVIERSVRGPELSSEERDRIMETLQRQVENLDVTIGDLPFGVPERKPPINRIFFDEEGRLWVQRSVADGAPYEADIYDREGELVEVVQWPSGITLRLGEIRDTVAYGIRSGDLTIPQVVRLRF